MTTVAEPVGTSTRDESGELIVQWRRLMRAATVVALLTSPVVFVWFYERVGWGIGWSLLSTFIGVMAFRGAMDLLFRRFIPWPSLFGTEDAALHEEDVMNRRRAWYWAHKFRVAVWLGILGLGVYGVYLAIGVAALVQIIPLVITLPFLLLINFAILFGPIAMMGISQIEPFEPGDADWGVKLQDVRGQPEAKEEVRRVVTLWQSGEAFESAGGKRERGLLMLGAPGTGKTMLSKAIATGFNCPFVSIPGSGFAGMFIGMDILTVRYLAWKAKRLARKWGGQCIVFIDEIDAVGQRRSSLGTSMSGVEPLGVPSIHDFCFYGPDGALTSSGDLVIETREWRDRLFAARAQREQAASAAFMARVAGTVDRIVAPGGMFGQGSGALNALLVLMDALGGPPFWRRFWVNRL